MVIKIKLKKQKKNRKGVDGSFTFPNKITLFFSENSAPLDIISTLAHELGHFFDGTQLPGHEAEYIADLYATLIIGKKAYIRHLEEELKMFSSLEDSTSTHPSHKQRIAKIKKTKNPKKEIKRLQEIIHEKHIRFMASS